MRILGMVAAAATVYVATMAGAIGAQSLAWGPAEHVLPAASASEPSPRGIVRQVEPVTDPWHAADAGRIRVTYLERYGDGRAWLEVSTGAAYRIRGGVRPCRSEDSTRPCVWDARHQGNGRGRSFIVLPRGGTVAYMRHAAAHQLVADFRAAR